MDQSKPTPLAVAALSVAPRAQQSRYPEPFFSRVRKREKRALGDVFGLENFGVNLTRLLPGAESSILHRHSKQDELVYIITGEVVLVTDEGEITMTSGMCAGFPASGRAHHLVNRGESDVLYLEIGDRTPGDEASYPGEDLGTAIIDGQRVYTHKNGTPY